MESSTACSTDIDDKITLQIYFEEIGHTFSLLIILLPFPCCFFSFFIGFIILITFLRFRTKKPCAALGVLVCPSCLLAQVYSSVFLAKDSCSSTQ